MTETRKPLTHQELLKLQFLGEVQITPDGKKVVYEVYQIDQAKNAYQGRLWLHPLDQEQPVALTGGDWRDSLPRLSPDGSKLAFLSNRADPDRAKRQLFLLDLAQPGDSRQLTYFQSGVNSFVWSPDNSQLVALVETPDDSAKAALHAQPESATAEQERLANEREEKRIKGNSVTFTQLKMRADGRRSLIPADAHTQAWLLDTATPENAPRQLTTGAFEVTYPVFTPDAKSLIFTSVRDQQQADFSSITDLWQLDLNQPDAPLIKITASAGLAIYPAVSPDGSQVAFVGHTNPKDGSYREIPRVWVMDLAPEATPRCLTADFDCWVANLVNTDLRAFGETPLVWNQAGDAVYFLAVEGGATRLFEVATSSTQPPIALTPADRHIYSYSFAVATGELAYSAATPALPGEVFIANLRKRIGLLQLTHLNDGWLKDYYLAEVETTAVPSADGTTTIESWVLLPPNFDPSKKYPLVLQMHGGPHTAYGNSFYFEFQVLAGAGNVVLYTNPRGSVGYGYDFASAIYNDWGHHDYDDIITALDWLITRGFIDEANLGVTGGSYGGYLTNWIVTHTQRFKTAITQRCVSNLVTMYSLSDIGFSFVESEFEGNPWTNPRIWECSPMAHADKARTPLLILHSEADYRCPIEQAEEFYFALKRFGCEVQLVRTPNEDHNLSRSGSPAHRLARLERIVNWFGQYLHPAD